MDIDEYILTEDSKSLFSVRSFPNYIVIAEFKVMMLNHNHRKIATSQFHTYHSIDKLDELMDRLDEKTKIF